MSNPFSLKVGSIIHEMESNIDHRVIYENGDCFVTILMHLVLCQEKGLLK